MAMVLHVLLSACMQAVYFALALYIIAIRSYLADSMCYVTLKG